MSDVKPTELVTAEAPKVEETPAVVAPLEVTPAPAAEESATKPVDEVTESKPEAEAPKVEEKPEPKEITHGTLAKAHQKYLLQFFKRQRFFFFQDDAIPEEKLKVYLAKPTSSKATAAYATQTGKGLWFYSKDESHKDSIHGIIKLADVTDVTPAGANKFVLKSASGELHFEAPAAERDNWVFSLNHKVEEAKGAVESVVESEGYKAALEKLTKPPVPPKPVAAEKAPETAEETKPAEETTAEASDKPAEEAKPVEEAKTEEAPPKPTKRLSVFGFLDKKKSEKKEEVKEEDKKEEAKPTEEPKPVEVAPVVENLSEAPSKPTEEVKPTEEATTAEETKPAEEAKAEEPVAPKPTKRLSVFGFLDKKKSEKSVQKEEAKEEAKEETPAAPVVATEEPAKETPAAEPVAAPAAETPAEKPVEAHSPTSPKEKIMSFLRRDKSPAPKAAPVETETAPAVEEPKPSEAAVTETPAAAAVVPPTTEVTEAPKETPVEETAESATATSPIKEKRKSIFSSFNKKSEDGESKSNLFSSLTRKASAAARGRSPGKSAEKETAETPAVAEEPEVKKDETVTETKAETAEPVKETEPVVSEKPAQIGDVPAAAVSVGEKPAAAA